jgi:hypothetical protein
MSITITLKSGLSPRAEQWLAKNVGPRMHYLHNSIGGEGWLLKLCNEQLISHDEGGSKTYHARVWKLTLEDDRFASWFLLQFPQ